MATKGFGGFDRRQRYGMFIGLGVAASIAAMVYSPEALRELSRPQGAPGEAALAERAPPLKGPGRVLAITTASRRVRDCYRAEFGGARHREQVVIVSFLAEITAGAGVISEGAVSSGDGVSMAFDRCIEESLSRVPFSTTAPPGRQRITFPFVFDLSVPKGDGEGR